MRESTMGIVLAMFFVIALAFICARGCVGCKQIIAKHYGGTVTYKLDEGRKLINCTWKENEFWMLTETRPTNEAPKEYQFVEKSVMGVLQGTVIIKEQ